MIFKFYAKILTATADRFKHFWESKRFTFSDNTNVQLWLGFANYFTDSMKLQIYQMANVRYRKEAKRRKKI